MKLKTLCIALFLMTNHALAQDSWERYKPRTLNQIIQQHAPELVKVRGLEKVVSIISSDTFPSRVKAIYTGESRSISAKKKELIFYWVKSFGYRLEIADLFESELSFKEDSVEYWLPVQKQVSPYFAQELKKGDEVTLLLIWVGVRRESEQTDWVFLVNDFETTDQQQGAPQKSASVASRPMATKSTKMGHFNKQPSSKAQAITGCTMATHSKSRAWQNAVDLELISIEVEFDRLTTAQRNRRRFWGRL